MLEDRAAKQLLLAGDMRYEAAELEKAAEIWQSVIERYPRSKVRFEAHLKLGSYHLQKKQAYDKARAHFEAAAGEENRDDSQRAEATLQVGVCFYEARHYGQCFEMMRRVIERFPVSTQVNQAYYYIGLGHFKQGHYGRAIESLERVGTAVGQGDQNAEKLEAGKRFYVKIEDADLAILEKDDSVPVTLTTTEGDEEKLSCVPVGRNVRVVLGSLPSRLGRPQKGNGVLEVTGTSKVTVRYTDSHTAARQFNTARQRQVAVVGNALVQVMDGAFSEGLQGVVLGKEVNLQVSDADRDVGDGADTLQARVEVLRQKTAEEIETERNKLLLERKNKPQDPKPLAPGKPPIVPGIAGVRLEEPEPEVDPYKVVDSVLVSFTEVRLPRIETRVIRPADANATKEGNATLPAPVLAPTPEDPSLHTGVFRASVPLDQAEAVTAGNARLESRPGDWVRIVYLDQSNITPQPREITTMARCVEGNLGGVRVTRTEIADEQLALKTKLKTASALTFIGAQYKDFGLEQKAQSKFREALAVCEEAADEARKLGGAMLEETYVQLWRIYFAMDQLDLAAAMSLRLQREFPESGFLDEAILQQARVAQKRGDFPRAIALFSNLTSLTKSQLRGEGQYGIGECYEEMAKAAARASSEPLFERAFQAYKAVFDQFPESGRVGDAVAKMANFYYQKQDFARAVDVFEKVLADHPDANFLDVILFNYGRCLYRMDRKSDAKRRFDQLIDEFPESPLAAEAKRISQALTKATP